MLKNQSVLIDFILKEWLLIVSAAGFVIVSIYTGRFPAYSMREAEVLLILFVLFISVQGLQNSGFISEVSAKMEKGGFIPLKLISAAFFLSMFITNDAALIIIVPLTLSLNIDRRDIIVILEALAANAGSALTPLGNPQNLFIYWFYNLDPIRFIVVMAPFALSFFVLLLIVSFYIKANIKDNAVTAAPERSHIKMALIYGILFIIVLLSVLHVLPIESCFIVIAYGVIFDRRSLRIDYSLLVSFFFFFGLANGMKLLLASEIQHSGHVFLFSALASQFISNVPVALLFSKFTSNWQALLWGSNAGGFGSLFGSLANLIAYRFYITHKDSDNIMRFSVKFIVLGYIAFFMAFALYFIVSEFQKDNIFQLF